MFGGFVPNLTCALPECRIIGRNRLRWRVEGRVTAVEGRPRQTSPGTEVRSPRISDVALSKEPTPFLDVASRAEMNSSKTEPNMATRCLNDEGTGSVLALPKARRGCIWKDNCR